jgi:hypothetical protein
MVGYLEGLSSLNFNRESEMKKGKSYGSLGIAVVDPRILGWVRTHPTQNTDYSTVTPKEPKLFEAY